MALNIVVTFDAANSEFPAADPGGALLTGLMEEAAAYWEDIIENSGTLSISFYYDSGIPENALWSNGVESGGRFTSGVIRFQPTPAFAGSSVNKWYYDSTPTGNSEYELSQVLYRELSIAEKVAMFSVTPPPLLEVAYQGPVAEGAPAAAAEAADLWSFALRALGHGLGMSDSLSACAVEITDSDFDLPMAFLNGDTSATRVHSSGGQLHLDYDRCLMSASLGPEARHLPSAVDILSIATCPSPGWSDLDLSRQDFLPTPTGVNPDWNTPGNWVGGATPGTADDAYLRIGELAGVPLGVDLELNGPGFCRNLFLGESTDLRTKSEKLDVTRTVTIERSANALQPQIFVETGGELEAFTVLVNGGELDLTGGLADIGGDLRTSESTNGFPGKVVGRGTVDVAGSFVNNGIVQAEESSTLTFTSASVTGPWDLDGSTGDGRVLATTGNIHFASGALNDAFDGTMQVADPFTLTIAQPWNLGSGGTIQLEGGDPAPATMSGGLISASGGNIQCSANSLITAPVNFSNTVQVEVGENSKLELDAATTFGAGTFSLASGSSLQVDGTSTIDGGTFEIGTDANVVLDGPHSLNGGTFTAGTLRFLGGTTVGQPVTIDCDWIDLDGEEAAGKEVTLNSSLTINSSAIESCCGDNDFDGTLNISGQNSILTINNQSTWRMNGILNHLSGSPLTLTSIAGVPFVMSGTANVSNATKWDARATITGTVNVSGFGDRLALAGGDAANPNRIEGGSVNGLGVIRVAQSHLHGFGSIQARIDFGSGASLLADDGTLSLTGGFVNVPPLIGAADADGTLEVTPAWTLPATSTLQLAGGTVAGGKLTNNGTIQGGGFVRSVDLVNNGSISGTDDGWLRVFPAIPPDLDGTIDSHASTLNAIDGDLLIGNAFGPDAFDGTATIGPDRELRFVDGWALGVNGVLHINGGPTAFDPEATLWGGGAPGAPASILAGTINLDGKTTIHWPGILTSTCRVNFADSDTSLRLSGPTTIEAGATFTGPGRLTQFGGPLTLGDGLALGIALSTTGATAVHLGSSPGRAAIGDFFPSINGSIELDLEGRPATTAWDLLTVNGTFDISGTINVNFSVPDAQPGDTWHVIQAANVIPGGFNFAVSGLPAGFALQWFVLPDGLYLKLAATPTFAEWATARNLLPGQDGIDDDPDGDLLTNGIELFLDGDPLVAEPHLAPSVERFNTGFGFAYVGLRFHLSTTNLPSDLTLRAALSTDLQTWSHEETALYYFSSSFSLFEPVACTLTRVYRSKINFGDVPRQFLRLEVVSAAP